jgi:hypothetical protein
MGFLFFLYQPSCQALMPPQNSKRVGNSKRAKKCIEVETVEVVGRRGKRALELRPVPTVPTDTPSSPTPSPSKRTKTINSPQDNVVFQDSEPMNLDGDLDDDQKTLSKWKTKVISVIDMTFWHVVYKYTHRARMTTCENGFHIGSSICMKYCLWKHLQSWPVPDVGARRSFFVAQIAG